MTAVSSPIPGARPSRPTPPAAGSRASLLIAAVFFLAFLPSLPQTARYHTDEAFYTDAALQMVRTGDWITPRAADGMPRFQKPILTYWVVAASYRLFGVSFFTSRVPFLMAGAMVILLTHRLARRLFRDETTALVAAAFVAGNNQLMYAALRSMPDVLLSVAMTASLTGFAGAFFREPGTAASGPNASSDLETRRRDLALGYVGAGLAIATKGLLGLVLVLYALLFVAWHGRRLRITFKDGWAPGSIGLGLAIALFWFILIAVRHGEAGLAGFLEDQVASRIAPSAGELARLAVANAGAYLLAPFRDFFPWPLLALGLAIAEHRRVGEFVREHPAAVAFVLGWVLLLGVMFTGANLTRPRYLLPVWPPLGALLAALLLHLGRGPRAERVLARIRPLLLPIGLAGGAILLLAAPGMDRRILVAGAVWIAATLVLKASAWRRSLVAGLVAVSLFMLMVFSVYEGCVRPVLAPSPAHAWTARLVGRGGGGAPAAAPAVVARVSERYLAQVRVLSGGRVWPRRVTGPLGPAIAAAGARPLVLADDSAGGVLSALGYRLEPCGFVYPRLHARELWELLRTTDKDVVFDAMSRRFVLGVPP
jgi:4-amino-4-deoxy-L-arabinose transferase-like glycosyltransferase